MIDKNEQRFFGGQDVGAVVQQIQGALYQSGVSLQQTGPNTWSGRSSNSSYGMAPKVTLTTMPAQGGFTVDARVAVDFETNAIIVLVLSWVFFFPLAIILAILGYQDWQTRQNQLLAAIWAPVQSRMMAPPVPQYGPPAHPQGYAPPPGAPPPGGQA